MPAVLGDWDERCVRRAVLPVCSSPRRVMLVGRRRCVQGRVRLVDSGLPILLHVLMVSQRGGLEGSLMIDWLLIGK